MNILLSPAVAFHLGPLTVRWYGLIISCAMLLGVFLAYKEAQRQKLDTDHLLNIILLTLPIAVIGARLYYVIFQWDYYALHPEDIIAVWKGGLAIHGGLIAGILTVVLYCRHKKQSFWRWVDVMVPSVVLAQGIGRWGNFANKEAFGSVIEEGSFWSWIPMQVYVDGAYHHPTFLYESVWDILIFIALIILIRKPHRVGDIFANYLILYSVGRFFIEMLRTDSLMLGPLRVAMLISLAGVVIGLLILHKNKSSPVVDVANYPDDKRNPAKKGKNKK